MHVTLPPCCLNPVSPWTSFSVTSSSSPLSSSPVAPSSTTNPLVADITLVFKNYLVFHTQHFVSLWVSMWSLSSREFDLLSSFTICFSFSSSSVMFRSLIVLSEIIQDIQLDVAASLVYCLLSNIIIYFKKKYVSFMIFCGDEACRDVS